MARSNQMALVMCLLATLTGSANAEKRGCKPCPEGSIYLSEDANNCFCRCDKASGYVNKGGKCVQLSAKQKEAESEAAFWATAKTRNDCRKMFFERIGANIKLGARGTGALYTSMEQTQNFYNDCTKQKPEDLKGDCGYGGLFMRCRSSYDGLIKDRGTVKSAEEKLLICYNAVASSKPKGICFD